MASKTRRDGNCINPCVSSSACTLSKNRDWFSRRAAVTPLPCMAFICTHARRARGHGRLIWATILEGVTWQWCASPSESDAALPCTKFSLSKENFREAYSIKIIGKNGEWWLLGAAQSVSSSARPSQHRTRCSRWRPKTGAHRRMDAKRASE